jgi:hypothetical protein
MLLDMFLYDNTFASAKLKAPPPRIANLMSLYEEYGNTVDGMIPLDDLSESRFRRLLSDNIELCPLKAYGRENRNATAM